MKPTRWLIYGSIIICLGFLFAGSGLFAEFEGALSAEEQKQEFSVYSKDMDIPLPEPITVDSEHVALSSPIIQDLHPNSKLRASTEKKKLINVAVFVQFKDDIDKDQWLSTAAIQKFNEFYNTGENSLHTYYDKVSFNQLDVQTEFYPMKYVNLIQNGNSIYPTFRPDASDLSELGTPEYTYYTSEYERSYIEPYDAASNPNGCRSDVSNNDPSSCYSHERNVITDITKLAYDDPKNDNSSNPFQMTNETLYRQLSFMHMGDFANLNQYTLDQDVIPGGEYGFIDAVTFIFRGDQDATPVLWPHKYNMTTLGPIAVDIQTGDSVFLYKYAIVSADIIDGKGVGLLDNAHTNYGVPTHEFFHLFDAPDLYRADTPGDAVGAWDLMSHHNANQQYFLQYINKTYGSALYDTPEIQSISSTTALEDRTNMVVDYPSYTIMDGILGKNLAYKIIPKTQPDPTQPEYFYVEYRRKTEGTGFDSMIPGTGLLVYRVKENMPNIVSIKGQQFSCGLSCGNHFGPPDEVFVMRPNAISGTEEGKQPDYPPYTTNQYDINIENAALPRIENDKKITSIGKETTTVEGFDADALYFTNGENSGIRIVNISDPKDNYMEFTVLYDGESVSDNNDQDIPTEPSIEAPTGEILTATSYKTADQMVSFTASDTGKGIQMITISTSDGELLDPDQENTSVKQLTYTYTLNEAVKTKTIQLHIGDNGTYSIQVKNWDDVELAEPTTFSVDKIDKYAPNLQIQAVQSLVSISADDKDPVSKKERSGIDKNSLKYTLIKAGESEEALTYDHVYTAPFSVEKDFEGKVCAIVNDHAGNDTKECITIQPESTIDTIAPQLDRERITYLPSASWTNQNVTITLPIEDDASGIKEVCMETEDGELQKEGAAHKNVCIHYTEYQLKEMPSFILSKNGTYHVKMKDGTGNEAQASLTIHRMDKEGPQITSFTLTIHEQKEIEGSITASDLPQEANQQSGIQSIYYQYIEKDAVVQEEGWTKSSDRYTFLYKPAQGADGKLCVMAEDHAGNQSEPVCKSIQSTDQKAPVLSNTITNLIDITKDSSGWTNAESLHLSLQLKDEDSGIAEVKVVKDGEMIGEVFHSTSRVTSYTHEINISENGIYQVIASDVAGNPLQTSFMVNQFDRTAPIIDQVEKAMAKHLLIFSSNDTRVSFIAHDLPLSSCSGVSTIKYQLVEKGGEAPTKPYSDSEWLSLSTDSSFLIPSGFEGTLYAYAIDAAGNAGALFIEPVEMETQAKSNNAKLSSIQLDHGSLTPKFNPNLETYTVDVEHEVEQLKIDASKEDDHAQIQEDLTKYFTLKVGKNIIVLHVIAEDGVTTKEYQIEVTRKSEAVQPSKDATLKSLSLSSGTLFPAFSPMTLSYKASVEHDITEVMMQAKPTNPKAVIQGDVNKQINLKEGENILKVEIIAEDQKTMKTYEVHINRKLKKQDEAKSGDTTEATIQNEDGTIKIIGAFDSDYKVISEDIQVDEITLTNEVKNKYKLEDVFDIYITKNGERFDVQKDVKVSIQLKEELKGKTDLSVVYVAEDGTVQAMPSTLYYDYIEFTTNHFSKYAIVSNLQKENTGILHEGVKTGEQDRYVLIFLGTLISASVLIIWIRKNRNNPMYK